MNENVVKVTKTTNYPPGQMCLALGKLGPIMIHSDCKISTLIETEYISAKDYLDYLIDSRLFRCWEDEKGDIEFRHEIEYAEGGGASAFTGTIPRAELEEFRRQVTEQALKL